jgi:copper(I)-binding protein
MRLRSLLLAILALAAGSLSALAQDAKAGPITISSPWARASIGEAKSSAAYMKIRNDGDAPDRLLAVKSDAADHVMLHESRMEGEVMKMVHVEGGIEIPAHGSAELKPLGLHVMLMGLKRPLKDGDTVPLTLVFEKQGEVPVDAKVGKAP